MKRQFTLGRRFAIAAAGLAISAILFRSQVAEALVVRGDDLAYQGRTAQALAHYRRALWIDPQDATAADRYVFLLMQRHTNDALASAVAAANAFLARHPNDAAVLDDRAMCFVRERRYAQARSDFERAARSGSGPRGLFLAGWAALHAGDKRGARVLWQRAAKLKAERT